MNALLLLFSGLLGQSSDFVTVEGRVVNSITGRPVKMATVTLTGRADPSRRATATTDAEGRFAFPQVVAGTYGVGAAREGFLFTPPPPIQVEPRQQVKDLPLKLTPLGVISGKILDEDGEPIPNVQVRTARRRYLNGKRQLTPDLGATSDDRGEYRIFHLPPGRYYLGAYRYSSGAEEYGFGATFYPGTTQASAAPIEVAPGQEFRDIDLRLPRPLRQYRIGVKANTETRLTGLNVSLQPADRTFWNDSYRWTNRADGTLEYMRLAPGVYTVSAHIVDDTKGVLVAATTVEVIASDVDVALTLRPAVKVRGFVSMPSPEIDLRTLRVSLYPLDADDYGAPTGSFEKSRFEVAPARPARYRVRLEYPAPPLYLKGLRWNGDDLRGTLLDLSSGSDGTLELIVANDAGAIQGVVEARPGQAIPSTVALLPVSPESAHLAQETRTQPDGRFTFLNVPPGDYRVVALDQMEPGSAQDPEFAKEHEKHGVPVTVRAFSREAIDKSVPVIGPARQ